MKTRAETVAIAALYDVHNHRDSAFLLFVHDMIIPATWLSSEQALREKLPDWGATLRYEVTSKISSSSTGAPRSRLEIPRTILVEVLSFPKKLSNSSAAASAKQFEK
jgi:hypothetical protein